MQGADEGNSEVRFLKLFMEVALDDAKNVFHADGHGLQYKAGPNKDTIAHAFFYGIHTCSSPSIMASVLFFTKSNFSLSIGPEKQEP